MTTLNLNTDKNGAVAFAVSKTISHTVALTADSEIALLIPTSINIKNYYITVMTSGSAVYATDNNSANTTSIVGNGAGEQYAIVGGRMFTVTVGSTHLHLKSKTNCEVNIEFF